MKDSKYDKIHCRIDGVPTEKIVAALLKENDDLKEKNNMLQNRVKMLKEMLSCYCTYIHDLEDIIEGGDL